MKANCGILDSPIKRTKLTILSNEVAQDSEFRSFFGRTKDTTICIWDLLTFRLWFLSSNLVLILENHGLKKKITLISVSIWIILFLWKYLNSIKLYVSKFVIPTFALPSHCTCVHINAIYHPRAVGRSKNMRGGGQLVWKYFLGDISRESKLNSNQVCEASHLY